MRYQRILPRDLFNDANLLKCIGQITLLIENRKLDLQVRHRHSDKDFQIRQHDSDGSTEVRNIEFSFRNGWKVRFWRPMNARNPWPLYAHIADDEEDVQVFDDNGSLTDEFLARIEYAENLPSPI